MLGGLIVVKGLEEDLNPGLSSCLEFYIIILLINQGERNNTFDVS